jgi:hypothetical protein
VSNPRSLEWMIARWRACAAAVIAVEQGSERSERYRRAAEIARANDGLAAERARGNIDGAIWWALRLGQHLAQADLKIARAHGGARKAAEQQSEVAAKHAAWRAEAARLWAAHPNWSAMNVAARIDPAPPDYVRRVIRAQRPEAKK